MGKRHSARRMVLTADLSPARPALDQDGPPAEPLDRAVRSRRETPTAVSSPSTSLSSPPLPRPTAGSAFQRHWSMKFAIRSSQPVFVLHFPRIPDVHRKGKPPQNQQLTPIGKWFALIRLWFFSERDISLDWYSSRARQAIHRRWCRSDEGCHLVESNRIPA